MVILKESSNPNQDIIFIIRAEHGLSYHDSYRLFIMYLYIRIEKPHNITYLRLARNIKRVYTDTRKEVLGSVPKN